MAVQKFNISGGFFNSLNGDRMYTAEQMNRPYRRVISEGIFATPQGTPSTDLQVVSAGNGMNIKVKAGEGLLANKWFENPSDIAITVPSNSNVVPRRDSVILQIDNRNNTTGRTVNIIYKEGTPSSNPMPPDINNIDNVIERRIANIYVAAGATAINQDAITDLRGSSECPWVTSLIKQVDTSTLFTQYQTAYQNAIANDQNAFDAWFDTVKDTLASSTLIRSYYSTYVTVAQDETAIPINIPQFNKELDIFQVYINGLKLIPNVEYTVPSNSQITLTAGVDIGTPISFEVFKSIDGSDAETVVTQVAALQTDVNNLKYNSGWINFYLESGCTAYDAASAPAIRKNGNTVYIRGSIKNLNTLNVPICTLPDNMRPSMNHRYTEAIVANGAVVAYCVLEVRTTGSIYMIAKSTDISATAMIPIATQFIVG